MMKDDRGHRAAAALTVDVALPCAKWRKRVPRITALCREAALAALAASSVRVGKAELSLVLSDDAAIRELNRRWRGKDTPTNVLSFPVGAEPRAPGATAMLGDVILAFETVAREAREQGKTLGDHLRHLVVHGVLHLVGFDHENEREAGRMERLEIEILAGLGVADPYRAAKALAHG